MYQSDALDDWFRTRVAALLTDVDVYTDYVKGTLQDEDSDVSARVCNACEFLSSASAGVLAEEEQTKLLNAAEMKAEVEEIVAIAQMYLQWNRSKPNSRNWAATDASLRTWKTSCTTRACERTGRAQYATENVRSSLVVNDLNLIRGTMMSLFEMILDTRVRM